MQAKSQESLKRILQLGIQSRQKLSHPFMQKTVKSSSTMATLGQGVRAFRIRPQAFTQMCLI